MKELKARSIAYNDKLLYQIAKIHERIPCEFEPCSVTALDIELRYESMKRLLQYHDEIMIYEDKSLAAFIWYKIADHTHIKSLWVRSDLRGQGIAVQLKLQLERFSRQAGVHMIYSDVNPNNYPMIQLNKRLGYHFNGKQMVKEVQHDPNDLYQ